MLFDSDQPHETMVWKLRKRNRKFETLQTYAKLKVEKGLWELIFLPALLFRASSLWEAHTVLGISATEIIPGSDYYKPQFLTLIREFLPFPSHLLPTSQPHPLHPFSKGERYVETPLPALMTEVFRKLRHTSDTDFPNSPGMGRTDVPQMQHKQMQQKNI